MPNRVSEIQRLYTDGTATAVDVVRDCLSRIQTLDGVIRSFVTLRNEADVLSDAATVDKLRAAGRPVGRLAGIPLAIKDNICTVGLRTTCGSRMLENFVPPYDATVVSRIRAAGAVIIGKTNMDEFGMGSSTENSAFFPTLNPHDHSRIPGGTSGGSAAAVAAGFVPMALGSDTGGSVRQPAAFCGVVGVKPTYGRVSRYGLVSYASSFEQIGTLASGVADAALLLNVISGADERDSTSSALQPISVSSVDPRTFVVGIPANLPDGADPEVLEAISHAASLVQDAGFATRPIELEDLHAVLATSYVIACAEASSNLARYDGLRYGPKVLGENHGRSTRVTRSKAFGAEVQRRIMLGTFVLSAGHRDDYYGRALQVRKRIFANLHRSFAACDVIMLPVAPTPAFELGDKVSDPMQMYLADLYSVLANVAGIPAIALPCGSASSGLPLAVQIVARWDDDERLLGFAAAVERLLEGAELRA